jgi:hypothetical protein
VRLARTKIAACIFWISSIVGVRAQGTVPPTADQFNQLKGAAYFYGIAWYVSRECGFDHASADQDFKKAVQRWSLSPDQAKEVTTAWGIGAGFASDAPKDTRPANWCDQRIAEALFDPIHKLSVGETPTFPPPVPVRG